MTYSVNVQQAQAQKSRAIRALLRRPLLDGSSDDFAVVVAQVDALRKWFDDRCGWSLIVDARRGYARLRKLPAEPDATKPEMTQRSVARPFTRRRYALLAVVAAALGDIARQQVSLQDLVVRVVQLTADDETLDVYDATVTAERTAFVDALHALSSMGVLRVVDQAGDYERNAEANTLFDIDDRRLAQLLVAPRPPSASRGVDDMRHEDRYGSLPYAEVALDAGEEDGQVTAEPSEDQRRLYARHRVMRRLLDDPVVYRTDLNQDELQYVEAAIGPISSWLAEAGLVLERRAEGWSAVDPTEEATDVVFPSPNSVIHQAALLSMGWLAACRQQAAASYAVPRLLLESHIASLLEARREWARAYQSDSGGRSLANDVVTFLTGLRLVRATPDSVTVLPATARYRAVHIVSGASAGDSVRWGQ